MDVNFIDDLLIETKAGRLEWVPADGKVEGKNPLGYRCSHKNTIIVVAAKGADDENIDDVAFEFQSETVEFGAAAYASVSALYKEATASANREPAEE